MSVEVRRFSNNLADKVSGYHPSSASIPTPAGSGVEAPNSHVGSGMEGLPQCAHCRLPVEDTYMVRVRGRYWHPGCAVCSICHCSLTEFCFIMEGRLICRQDYIRHYAVKCAACKMPMLMHELCMRTAPNEFYHVNCFRCSVCGEQLPVGAEYARDPSTDAPICRKNCVARSSSSSAVGNGGGTTSESVTPSATYHQNFNSGRRGRTTLSTEQRTRLEQVFETAPKPSTKMREELAAALSLPVRVVQVWFQNQRAREKALSAKSVSSASPAISAANVNNNPPAVANAVAVAADVNAMSMAPAPSLPTSIGSPGLAGSSQYRPGMKKFQHFQWLDHNGNGEDPFQQ